MMRIANFKITAISILSNKDKAVQDLKNKITDRTKVIMYSSPCNPTGSVFSKEMIQDIAKVLAENENIYVIADEIYEYINFGEPHFSIGSVEAIKDRLMERFGVKNSVGLVFYAMKNQLID